jgi:hypothetical protein
MLAPSLAAGIEKWRDGVRLGVNPREVASFVQVAIIAGEAQIVLGVGSPMFYWPDVLNVKNRERGLVLVESAVFATVPRSQPHPRSQGLIHQPWVEAARNRRALACNSAIRFPART